jgi:CheY-like chemotaxis protein
MAKILLVEDDNNLREIYEARLQAEGYTIISAMDGEEALVLAKKEKPDLVISDVMMPRISGFEMLDILRNTEGLKEVKVIMLTALGQAEDKTRADNLGADRYLVKSQVTLEDIVRAAQELLGPADGTTGQPAATQPAATPVATPAPAVVAQTPATPAPVAPTPTVAQPVEPVVPAPAIPVVAPTASEPPTAPANETTAPPVAPATPAPEPPTVQPPAPTPVAPEPETTTPETNTPVPEPPIPVVPSAPAPPPAAEPATAPTPPAPAVETPPSSSALSQPSQAQSASAEEAAVKAQIENFVNQNNQTAPKPEALDEAMMADAIKNMTSNNEPKPTASTPKIISPVTPPTGNPAVNTTGAISNAQATAPVTPGTNAQPETEDDGVSIAHKKVIQPISGPVQTAPDLNELLAKEGISSLDDTSAAPVQSYGNTTPGPGQTTTPSTPSGAPGYSTPHPPGHVISPNGNSSVDPNSIAL